MKNSSVPALHLYSNDVFAVLQSLLAAKYLPKTTSALSLAAVDSLAGFGVDVRLLVAQDILTFFGCDTSMKSRQALAEFTKLSSWSDFICGIWENEPERLVFMTSGSTGEPTKRAYSFGVLEEEVDALAQYFSDRQRIVTVMPSHHIFGFVTSVLLPKRLKIPVVRMHPLPVAELFQTFQPGDLFIAFPRFWQIMLEMLQIKKETALALPADFAGLSSSAPCPVKIIEGLTGQSAPGAPAYCTGFVEIYGSTETSAVGVRTDCHSPYTLLPLWVRASHKEGKESEVEIERIRRDGRRETALALPDIVQWVDERAFFPLKRKDKAVQVGGFNVYPQQVADIIRTHPAVKDCVVRLMRPDEGGRLKAFIVLKNPWRTELRAVFGKEFKTWLREHIDSPAIPKAITFGENLPLTMTGKNSDWNIK